LIFALLTALFWTGGSYLGSKVARASDGPMANGMRLFLSLLFWTLVVTLVPGLPWPTIHGALLFSLAGFLHQALGDNALYVSYHRMGPRIGILLCINSSVLGALVLERFLIGGWPNLGQIVGMSAIVLGAMLALAPKERLSLGSEALRVGVPFAILAGLLQALGAVTSRWAYLHASLPVGLESSLGPTFLRVLGAVGGLFLIGRFPLMKWWGRRAQIRGLESLVVLSAFLGPFVGVFCYQVALQSVNSAVVQSVICAMPLMMMPVTWLLEGDRPSLRSALGALVAFGGMVVLLKV